MRTWRIGCGQAFGSAFEITEARCSPGARAAYGCGKGQGSVTLRLHRARMIAWCELRGLELEEA